MNEIPRCFKPLHGEKGLRPSGGNTEQSRNFGFWGRDTSEEDGLYMADFVPLGADAGEHTNVAAAIAEAMTINSRILIFSDS